MRWIYLQLGLWVFSVCGTLSGQEKLQFSWNPYATHQPILYHIATMTNGPIVEFGCGDGSTEMLHAICKETGRLLISIDNDEEWLVPYSKKFLGDGYNADNSGWHKFILVPKHEGNTLLEDWIAFLDNCDLLKGINFDLCFVDQNPGAARTETVLRFKDRAKYVILHDCDMYVCGELGKQIAPMDRKNQMPGIYDFSQTFSNFKVYFPPKPWAGASGPPTLLGSNFANDLPDVDFTKTCLIADRYQERFQKIYQEKLWGVNEEDEGFSGGGSLLENALPYYEYLVKFMRDHQIKSVVDLGCGDWTFSKHIRWDGIEYIGFDVVESVIEKNIQKYSTPNIRFIHANFLSFPVPKADLLICKHVLQHMPNKDVFAFLELLPHFKHCLILNAKPHNDTNVDYPEEKQFPFWEDRGIDITLPPFNVKGKRVLAYPQLINSSGIDVLIHVDNTE